MNNGNDRTPTRRGVELAYDAVIASYIHDISEHKRRPARSRGGVREQLQLIERHGVPDSGALRVAA
jgi:hypothetical protein